MVEVTNRDRNDQMLRLVSILQDNKKHMHNDLRSMKMVKMTKRSEDITQLLVTEKSLMKRGIVIIVGKVIDIDGPQNIRTPTSLAEKAFRICVGDDSEKLSTSFLFKQLSDETKTVPNPAFCQNFR